MHLRRCERFAVGQLQRHLSTPCIYIKLGNFLWVEAFGEECSNHWEKSGSL